MKRMSKATSGKYTRRPIWREYTLIKYEGRKIIAKEKIWVDESIIFPTKEALV